MSLSLKGHSGQVFPLSLAVLAVACVVFFVVFNSGRAVNEKINLVNAADASAYSGAQVAARHLNFMAYTNRAMVANEAAIGHLYSFQVEVDLLGKIVQEGVGGGGLIGDFVRWLLGVIIGDAFEDSLDLIAQVIQPIVDTSKVFTGMLSLMLDANNASFANFQQQAYEDLIRPDPNTGYTVVEKAMSVVASSYISRANAPITVNSPTTLQQFITSDNQTAATAATEAANAAAELCEMILFAAPGMETGNALGSSYGARSQNCQQAVSGIGNLSISIPGTPMAPEADGGLMIDAIRQTVATMENATWIRDRNMDNYSFFGAFRADRAGETNAVFNPNTGNINWVAEEDSFELKFAGIQFFRTTEDGNAAQNVEEATAMINDAAIQGLRFWGLCTNGGSIDCNSLANNSYDSVQRYAALDPNRQKATITAFLHQSNCSDHIGFDDDGNRLEGWSDNLRPFEEQESICGKNVYAIGQAEVYFQRPDCYEDGNASCSRTDNGFSRLDNSGSVEVPNLYNPFWHARLIASGIGGVNE